MPITKICPGPTNVPTQGLRYRVAVSVPRVLDSAIAERAIENAALPTGTVPPSAVPPFILMSTTATPEQTSMQDTEITRMRNAPNYARVKTNVVVPMNLNIRDSNGIAFQTQTFYTCPEDIVLYMPPETSTFPYRIICECNTVSSEGTATRDITTISKLCARIVTRVVANTDLLIPSYGYAPISPAIPYEDETCRNFFNQPLFPNGKASPICFTEN